MKFLSACLVGLLILAGGCGKKDPLNPGFMPGCYRPEVVSSTFYVPEMTNEMIAQAIQYCLEYSHLGVAVGNRVSLMESTTYCNLSAFDDASFIRQMEQNIKHPGYWVTPEQQSLMMKQFTHPGFVDSSYDLANRTITVRYKSSETRLMNFEQRIALMGLSVNNRPAEPRKETAL